MDPKMRKFCLNHHGKVQQSMRMFIDIMGQRAKMLSLTYQTMLKQLKTVHQIMSIQTWPFLPIWYTGDGCTMYQMDNTNIIFTQTEIS